jgi:hypothetical protein
MKPIRTVCEVCKSPNLVMVLNLGKHPMCDDLIKIGSSETCEEFELSISLCNECLTAHQMHLVPKRRLFPSSYHYRSSMTQDVLNGMAGLVQELKQISGDLIGKFVVDVGCNDGSLLKIFTSEGARVHGIEPTSAARDAVMAGVPVTNDYLDVKNAQQIVDVHGNPDFVTFTNVFAHIENMDELLESVRILLGKNGRLVVENHYLGAVLDSYQFDTFYHEHPRTYSLTSFVAIAKRLGKNIEHYSFPCRYGGNIRVIIGPGKASGQDLMKIVSLETDFINKFSDMRAVIDQWIRDKEKLLESVRNIDGKVYAKAFPGRAAIMIKLLGLTSQDIVAVFEKSGSMKIGHYVPGTKIPIRGDNEMLATIHEPYRVLNLAWHIRSEIHSYLGYLDPRIKCFDIFSPSEYKLR